MLTRSDRGSAIVVSILTMMIVLALGLALLATVDTQTQASGVERSRDQSFTLAETVLNNETFVIGQNWPTTPDTAPIANGAACGTVNFAANLSGVPTPTTAGASRLLPALQEAFTGPQYAGASFSFNVCDNTTGSSTWSDAVLANPSYDQNLSGKPDGLMWVRAVAVVGQKRSTVTALVRVGRLPAFDAKFGMIAGRISADIGSVKDQLSQSQLLQVAQKLLGDDPTVAPDPGDPSSGVVGLRCGALDLCLAGALAGLSATAPPLTTLINDGRYVPYKGVSSTSDNAIAQFRSEAKSTNTWIAPFAGAAYDRSPPACPLPSGDLSDKIVYLEQITGGDGGDYCVIDTSRNPTMKMLVIARGRVILRGDGDKSHTNRFTGVVDALNLQRNDTTNGDLTPREVVRIDNGAHVKGSVMADGKSGQIGVYPANVDKCQGVFSCVLSAVTNLLNTALGSIDSYGSAVEANVNRINGVTTYRTARVVPGTFTQTPAGP